ncbi:MAG: hypothetical protein ACRC2T_04890 [Thermoguttaceae bacterium]
MFSNVGKTEDIQSQTLINSGNEPTNGRGCILREVHRHTGLRYNDNAVS